MFESSYVNVVLIIVEISKLLYTDCYSYKKNWLNSRWTYIRDRSSFNWSGISNMTWCCWFKRSIDVHLDAYMRRSLKPCYAFYMYDSSFYDFSDSRNNISKILSDSLLSQMELERTQTCMHLPCASHQTRKVQPYRHTAFQDSIWVIMTLQGFPQDDTHSNIL